MEIKIILLFFLCFEFKFIVCSRCGTNQLKITPSYLDIGDIQRRKLDNDYYPINIKVDMTYLKSQNILNDEQFKNLEETIEEVTGYFKTILSVQKNYFQDNKDLPQLINNNCEIPKFDLGDKNFDLLIIPKISSDLNKNQLAAGAPCVFLTNQRPVAGVVLINNNLSWEKNNFKYNMKTLLLHEFSHVLAFHPHFFKYLNMISTRSINGQQYDFITSPKVIEKAKIHFGCDSIKGVQLENDGGDGTAGSHWDSRFMLGDYMMASDYQDVVLSDISLALFEDTRFYQVNYYTGGLFRFGKNQGCSFIEKKCLYDQGKKIMFPNDFCNESGKSFCSSSHISRGNCYISNIYTSINEKYRYFGDKHTGGLSHADYCPVSFSTNSNNYYFPNNCRYGKIENEGEIISEDSLCFESSIKNSGMKSVCYKMECNPTSKIFSIYIDSKIVNCPGNETILSNPNGLSGQIKCPDYNLVCTSQVWCNDIFDCIEKKSEADLSTYDYLYNKLELQKRDSAKLEIDDSILILEDKSSIISLNLNLIILLFMLLINF
jgi:hypothetical protein